MKKCISVFVAWLIILPAFCKEIESNLEDSTAILAGKIIAGILFVLFILYLVRRRGQRRKARRS